MSDYDSVSADSDSSESTSDSETDEECNVKPTSLERLKRDVSNNEQYIRKVSSSNCKKLEQILDDSSKEKLLILLRMVKRVSRASLNKKTLASKRKVKYLQRNQESISFRGFNERIKKDKLKSSLIQLCKIDKGKLFRRSIKACDL